MIPLLRENGIRFDENDSALSTLVVVVDDFVV